MMDWSKLISEIMNSGLTQAETARRIGLTSPSIIDLTSGRQKSVKYEVGKAIIDLHRKVTRTRKAA